ncbi:MAG: hypothetical protein ACQERN_04725 [Thermodesulfobacteriota bacterium]
MKQKISVVMILLFFVAMPWHTASAYVGPGAGLSLLGALWGLVIAIFAALGFILFWPLRQAIRRARAKRAENADDDQLIFEETEEETPQAEK